MTSPIAMISLRLTPSRGKKFSLAAPMTTAENFSPPLSQKRRRQKRRRNFSLISRRAAASRKGRAGTPLALSHGFYNTLSSFIQGRFHEKLGPGAALLEQIFSRFMEGRDPTQFTLREKATFVAQGVLSGKIFELAKPANVSLWNELSRYFARPEVKEKIAREVEVVAEPERRAFLLANIRIGTIGFSFFSKVCAANDGGKPDRRACRRSPPSRRFSLSCRLTSMLFTARRPRANGCGKFSRK